MKKRKFTIKNNNKNELEVFIEPAAEFFTLRPEKVISIEISGENKNMELFELEIDESSVVIYESPQIKIEIFLEGERVYYSDY